MGLTIKIRDPVANCWDCHVIVRRIAYNTNSFCNTVQYQRINVKMIHAVIFCKSCGNRKRQGMRIISPNIPGLCLLLAYKQVIVVRFVRAYGLFLLIPCRSLLFVINIYLFSSRYYTVVCAQSTEASP